jgi:hypothetical protein
MSQSSTPACLMRTSLVNMRLLTTIKEREVNTMVTTTVGMTAAGMNILLDSSNVAALDEFRCDPLLESCADDRQHSLVVEW